MGAQVWLGVNLPIPDGTDLARVDQVKRWLGAPSPGKQALAQLFLCSLVDHLVLRSSLTFLGAEGSAGDSIDGPSEGLPDLAAYRRWYSRPDGQLYTLGADHDDGMPGGAPSPLVEGLKRRILYELEDATAAEALIEGILRPSQPPCHHRFQRYLDIQLTSIGALEWRGNLPPDDGSKERWKDFWGKAEPALDAWAGGAPPADLPQSIVASRIYEALGAPNEEKRAIIREFLRQPPPAGGFYQWLRRRVRHDATVIAARLR